MTRNRAMRFALLGCGLALGACGPAADLNTITLKPTYTLDLETGKAGGRGPEQDLFWQAMTRTERCLGPSIQSRTLLAPLPAREFDAADAAKLFGLDYSPHCFTHTNSGGEVQKGFTFAVRTVEGNFAKVRVAGISSGNELNLEWRLFPAAAGGSAGAAASNPSLSISALLEQARQLVRTQRSQEAVPLLEQVVAQAQKLPAGAQRAQALSEAGRLLWSARRMDLAESALRSAAQEMDGLPASAIPSETRRMTYRMLGVVYRDQRKFSDAIPWIERALKTAEALPEGSPQATGLKHLHITSELGELATAQCGAGNAAAAEAADQRRLDTCQRMPNAPSAGSCRQGKQVCVSGWMRAGR